jgi:hypothetical protein
MMKMTNKILIFSTTICISFLFNWGQIEFNSNIIQCFYSIWSQLNLKKINQIEFEFYSRYMQCSRFSFQWNFICNFFFFLVSLLLVMHSNVKPKLINHSTVFPKKKQREKTMYFCFLCDSVFLGLGLGMLLSKF